MRTRSVPRAQRGVYVRLCMPRAHEERDQSRHASSHKAQAQLWPSSSSSGARASSPSRSPERSASINSCIWRRAGRCVMWRANTRAQRPPSYRGSSSGAAFLPRQRLHQLLEARVQLAARRRVGRQQPGRALALVRAVARSPRVVLRPPPAALMGAAGLSGRVRGECAAAATRRRWAYHRGPRGGVVRGRAPVCVSLPARQGRARRGRSVLAAPPPAARERTVSRTAPRPQRGDAPLTMLGRRQGRTPIGWWRGPALRAAPSSRRGRTPRERRRRRRRGPRARTASRTAAPTEGPAGGGRRGRAWRCGREHGAKRRRSTAAGGGAGEAGDGRGVFGGWRAAESQWRKTSLIARVKASGPTQPYCASSAAWAAAGERTRGGDGGGGGMQRGA